MHALFIRGSGNEEKQDNYRVLDGTNSSEFARADLPDSLLLRASSVDENLFATCVVVGSLFLLVVVDAISIVVAEALGTVKRWSGPGIPSTDNYLPVESVCNKRIDLTDMSEKIRHRDVLYSFACHLEWRTKRNLAAYHELIAALDDQDGDIRRLAGTPVHRGSPSLLDVRRAAKLGERTGCHVISEWQTICSLMDGSQWQHWC